MAATRVQCKSRSKSLARPVADRVALFAAAIAVLGILGLAMFIVEWIYWAEGNAFATLLFLSLYIGINAALGVAVVASSTSCVACARAIRKTIAPRLLFAYFVVIPIAVWIIGSNCFELESRLPSWLSAISATGLASSPVLAIATWWATGSRVSGLIAGLGGVATVAAVAIFWLLGFGVLAFAISVSISAAVFQCPHTGLSCVGCGYDLRGLAPSTPCPECGSVGRASQARA